MTSESAHQASSQTSHQTSSQSASNPNSATGIPSVSVSTISDVYHTLVEQGIEPDYLHEQLGVSLEDIQDLDARLPVTKLQEIWQIAIDRTNNPAIGLQVGKRVDPRRFSVVAQASFQCDTVRDVLQMYGRFFSVVNQSASLLLIEQDDQAVIEFRYPVSDYYCIQETERMMSTALARCSYILGQKIRVKAFTFEHAEPEYVDQYKSVFEAPMSFGQEVSSIIVNKGLLDLKIKHGNPYLLSVLSGYAEKLLKKLSSSADVTTKVRSFIKRHLADEKSLDVKQAAKALNMSRHTLYRKLKKENVSFQALVEEVRREEAKSYLAKHEVSISEVAFLLGFSELSAFSRAFKRWTGQSPAQYRSAMNL